MKFVSHTVGVGWSTNTIISNNNVGSSSIKLDNKRNIYISYYDISAYNLGLYCSTAPVYTSSKYNATTSDYNWRNWGKYSATEYKKPTGSTINHYTKTATTSDNLDTTDWSLTTNNQVYASNVESWIQYKI